MATYNWAYKPNTPNKYGLAISNTADNVKPNNAAYVALFGNDDTGNGSRMYPYKTIKKACTLNSGQIIVIASGVYREIIDNYSTGILIGDGDVVIDYSFFIYQFFVAGEVSLYNIKVIGPKTAIAATGADPVINAYDCVFESCVPSSNGGYSSGVIKNCTIRNYPKKIYTYSNYQNCTFYKCNNINVSGADCYANIFYNCNLNFINITDIVPRYVLFYLCTFMFSNNLNGSPDYTLYPTIQSGFSYYDSIQELIDAAKDFKPALLTPFKGCLVSNPKFNNPDIGDHSLAFDSPAKNLSYFGTYVGAQSIAYPVKASSTEADGGFDFSTAVNLNISDDSITMADNSLLASIETKVISNLIQRELGKAPIYGFNADRNGQYIDSIADLANVTIAPGTNLATDTPYIVEVAAIVNDGHTIQPGERFTTTSVVSFTSAGGGVCREIIEAPQRHTIMARFADVEADLATTPYQHYEPGIKFTSNNVGDSRTGAIVRGNGDPLYERGTGKEFAINARFIQVKYIIQPNNLKP